MPNITYFTRKNHLSYGVFSYFLHKNRFNEKCLEVSHINFQIKNPSRIVNFKVTVHVEENRGLAYSTLYMY
jgi:hypothetical protein